MAFPPFGNSDHVGASVSIGFPSNSKGDAPFLRVAYDYSRADCDGLRDHLRDVHRDFWRAANSVLNKGKSAIPALFNGPELLSSAFDEAKLIAKNVSKNSNLDGSGISLPIFSSKTNLKLLNIYVTLKLVKFITNLDSSKASSPDCIPVAVLKNCEPELPYIQSPRYVSEGILFFRLLECFIGGSFI